MERSAASLEQRNLLLPQEQRGAFVKRAVPKGERFHNRRPRCRGASTRCDLQRGVYRARSARAAGSGGAICRWQADGMDRNAAAVCEPRRTGGRFSYAGERRSGHRSRHGGGLRREAYQRRGCRGRTTGARGGKARKSCLDTRRGVHLGILPPRGCDRSQKRRRGRRHADGLGISQLPFRHVWDRNALRCSESTGAIPPGTAGFAQRVLSRSGRDGKPFCARNAHGCAGARGQSRSSRISFKKSFQCTNAGRAGSGNEVVRLAAQENAGGTGLRPCLRG